MVQADLFSGSLAIWNALGFRIHFVRLIRLRRRKFKLSLEYSANWNFAKNLQERKLNLATRSTRFGAPVSSEFAAKRRGVLWSAAALRPRACPSETDRRRRGATLSNREVSIVIRTPFSRHFRNTPPAPLIESKGAFCTQRETSCSLSTVFFRGCSISYIR